MKHASNAARDELRALAEEHRNLDERLRTLTRRAYLTPHEQQEASLLKRKKLLAKDRMTLLSKSEAAE